jgi:HD-like signal output (HDOD) protein
MSEIAKKRILFVDDERSLLDGLRARLRPQRTRWQMSFVDSGHLALEFLAHEPVDVVVSDIRMPGMDGTALLEQVRDRYPGVARIVLSGHADDGALIRAMATAHVFLPKPCEAGVLEGVVERVCGLQRRLSDEAIRAAIGQLTCLPAPPAAYSRLLAAVTENGEGARAVGSVVREDPALGVQILRVVNSPYFGVGRAVLDLGEAVVFLGMSMVRQLALTVELFRQASSEPSLEGISLDEVRRHSLLSAGIASSIVSSPRAKEMAFIAALLHDVGKLLLATKLQDRGREVIVAMRQEGKPMHVVEQQLFGVTHAEIGGYLLGLWHLPFAVVEAVANHHTPDRAGDREGTVDVVTAVHVADALAIEQHGGLAEDGVLAMVDPAHLERLGIQSRMVGEWRETARRLAAMQETSPTS